MKNPLEFKPRVMYETSFESLMMDRPIYSFNNNHLNNFFQKVQIKC